MSDRLTVLVSGGPDSLILWRLAQAQGREPRALYVMHGQANQGVEMNVLRRVAEAWQRFDVHFAPMVMTLAPLIDRQDPGTGHIPLRNDLFVRIAALDADEVWLGALAGESSRDKSGRFLGDTSRSLTYLLERPVTVRAPAKVLTKRALVRAFYERLPQEARALLPLTRSCYRQTVYDERSHGCGACPACWRRFLALAPLGFACPMDADPRQWAKAQVQTQGGLWPTIRATLRRVPLWEWPSLLVDALDQRAMVRRV